MSSIKKILIVEDEKSMATALKLKLDNTKIVATIAFDGKEAMNALKTEKFDLIILDIVMPKMDGFSFLKKLKKEKKKIPVIVVSNLSQNEDIEMAKKLGAIKYFVKSETPIINIINSVIKILEK